LVVVVVVVLFPAGLAVRAMVLLAAGRSPTAHRLG
jgi:hypothetical protein